MRSPVILAMMSAILWKIICLEDQTSPFKVISQTISRTNPAMKLAIHHLIFAFAALGLMTAPAVEVLDWREYDKNGDERLDEAEQDVYLLHCHKDMFREYDTDKDGKLSPGELNRLALKANADAAKYLQKRRRDTIEYAEYHGLKPNEPMDPEQFKKAAGIVEAEVDRAPEHFRLRGSVEDFAQRVDADNPLGEVAPADFSFARNYLDSTEQWSAKGAVGGIWEDKTSFQSLSLGAQFHRLVTDSTAVTEVNSLIFKALFSNRHVIENNFLLSSLGYKGGATYGTDFDWDGGLIGGTLDVTPLWNHKAFTGVWSIFGTGTGYSASNRPALALSNFIRIEGGGTAREFENQPVNDDEYLRIGPQVDATLWPMGLDVPLTLTASYANYFEALGSGRDYRNYSFGAGWQLDKMGRYILKAEYQSGMTPLLLTDVEAFTLGLSVRF